MKSYTAILIAAVFLIGIFIWFRAPSSDKTPTSSAGSNVSVVDGTQIVEIKVKGGYLPASSQVKAGMPTILRFETDGTFDCSSSIRIPSLGLSKSLPPTGSTDIALGALQPGTLQGTCGMGMYRFSLEAKS